MLERLSRNYVKILSDIGVIDEDNKDDADIHAFGFYQSIMMIVNIITTLIVSILLHMVIPCLLLNLAYIPIRINAGGHHADSPLRCYFNSLVIIISLLMLLKYLNINIVVSLLLLVVSNLIIILFAPVETENNPLEEYEKLAFKKRTRIVLSIECFISLLLLILRNRYLVSIIALGITAEACMILAGIIKLKLKRIE